MQGKNRKRRKSARTPSELSLDLMDQVSEADDEVSTDPSERDADSGAVEAEAGGQVPSAPDPHPAPPLRVIAEAGALPAESPASFQSASPSPSSEDHSDDEEPAPPAPAVFEYEDHGTPARRSRFPSRPQKAPRTASQVRSTTGRPVEAVPDESSEIERLEMAAAQSDDPELMVELGQIYLAGGRYSEAEEWLRRAQRLDPDRADVRTRLGILAFRRGLYLQAESDLKSVCELHPEDGLAFLYRGEALNLLGRIDEAFEAVETALRLNPQHSRAHYLMGILLDRKNRHQEASTMYRRARELANR